MNGNWGGLKKATIMLVDDEPVMLDIVQALLEEAGYRNFIAVDDSREAIARMELGNPDIMMLDLDMPEVDGFEILTRVRRHEKYGHLPVIILTASEDPVSKLRALELGATDFLSKPVDESELALRVRNTLSAKAYQDQLAYYDSLTGLPNRQLFIDRLAWSLQLARRDSASLVLLDLGLDRFKHINETLGMSAGDTVLRTVVERLKKVSRKSDVVAVGEGSGRIENMARISGDEFSMVLFGLTEISKATLVCRRILDAIEEPIKLNGKDLYLSAGIGMSVFPDDGDDVETLVKFASAAKEHSKRQGGGRYLFYSSEMNKGTLAILRMEADLKKAFAKREFELHYQPKINVTTGKTIGMESLIRWNHPEQGLIPPAKFIPVAENMGLIVQLGAWVLREACRQTRIWNTSGFPDLKVSVNVSAKQFENPGFTDSVTQALSESGLKPENLVLEITESTLMGDIDRIVQIMRGIRETGVSFSLDDFGTGYSSLNYLKRFPIGELKIDRSFLLEIKSRKEDRAIVKAIIALAHALDQDVVAEGVEDLDQLKFLTQNGCNVIQGYYFCKPLGPNQFRSYLDNYTEIVAM